MTHYQAVQRVKLRLWTAPNIQCQQVRMLFLWKLSRKSYQKRKQGHFQVITTPTFKANRWYIKVVLMETFWFCWKWNSKFYFEISPMDLLYWHIYNTNDGMGALLWFTGYKTRKPFSLYLLYHRNSEKNLTALGMLS